MGALSEKVNEVLKNKKKKKWEILKECCEDDIKKMIENGVSIRKQLQIILEAKVIDKLTLSEYYKMLKLHFGYQGQREKVRVFEVSKNASVSKKQKQEASKSSNESVAQKRGNVKEELKKDINILQVAGIDVDSALSAVNDE